METEDDSYYFDPIRLFVESGTTVIWTIESGIHSSTAYAESIGSATVTRIPKEATPWNSGTLSQQDATFEHTFETPGTYDYFCIPPQGARDGWADRRRSTRRAGRRRYASGRKSPY
jgi:plastocyanin